MINNIDLELLKKDVLNFVSEMKVDNDNIWEYNLSKNTDSSVFTSCFAIFIRHTFKDLDKLSPKQKLEWINYLQSFQNEDSGLFSSEAKFIASDLHDQEHLDFQLGTFCIAALKCLGSNSLYPLKFVEKFHDKEAMYDYLSSLNWKRSSNSGNKSMFLALALIHNFETYNIQESKLALNYWFEWMDRNTNKTGFWGVGKSSLYFDGMAGFYHQFMIYFYMNKSIKKYKSVIDKLLFLQQPDGLFYPVSGGGSCMDIDAVTPLCYFYKEKDYRKSEIRNSLERVLPSIIKNQNKDGGFCWSQINYLNPKHYFYLLSNLFYKEDIYHWFYCIRRFVIGKILVRSARPKKPTGWSSKQRLETESSLFDTWLRCTTILQIQDTLGNNEKPTYNFLEFPGLCWFTNK